MLFCYSWYFVSEIENIIRTRQETEDHVYSLKNKLKSLNDQLSGYRSDMATFETKVVECEMQEDVQVQLKGTKKALTDHQQTSKNPIFGVYR